MQQIQATASFMIPAGNADAFEAVARELIAAVREREPKTLQYLWYYSDDRTTCSVREIYSDSEAVLHHLANCADILPRLFELGEVSVELCGDLSDELRGALVELNPPVLRYGGGVDRLLEV